MKPRVAHMVASGGLYGAERVIITLSKEMLRLGLADPILVCLEDSPEGRQQIGVVLAREGVEVHHVPVRNLRPGQSTKALRGALTRAGADLAHSHGYKALILGRTACQTFGIPIVATNHGWDSPTWRVRLYQRWEAHLMRSIAAVVAVSQAGAKQIRQRGVPACRTVVIPNGVPVLPPGKTARSLRRELGLGCGVRALAFVGQLVHRKGLDVLLNALGRAAGILGDFRLFIAGDGPLRDKLRAHACALGLSERVSWLGFRRDIETVYEICDLVVLPSRYEGMPMTILEAMSHGRAVLATDVGGAGEVIQDGINGRLVPARDVDALASALRELLADDNRRDSLAREARRTVMTQYSSDLMAARYAVLYRRVLGCAEIAHGL